MTLKPPGSLTVRNLGFSMSGVFGEDATQKDVYDASAAELVDRVLAGCNSTMLAYGQTGSGKTYTMLGGEKAKANLDKELGEEHGIIPRACKQLFEGIKPGQTIKVGLGGLLLLLLMLLLSVFGWKGERSRLKQVWAINPGREHRACCRFRFGGGR